MKYLLLIMSFNSFAGITLSQKSYNYNFDRPKVVTKNKYKKTSKLDALMGNLSESDRNIELLLLKQEKKVIVRRADTKLKALTRIKGTLINSVLATNHKATTVIIKLEDNEFFTEGKVRCQGLSYGKRIIGDCNLIVSLDEEYSVDAKLWDLDGAEGLVADQFYDGQEKEFLTSSFSSFFEGAIQASKDTFVTPYGRFSENSNKNQALSGLEAIAKNVNSKIKISADKNIQIALINSGREVIVYFNQSVKL